MRAIAVDWSGAKTGAEKKIWLGEAAGGELVRLEDGRDRDGIARTLIEEAVRDPVLVVGLDFAFSLPAWFLGERKLADGPTLWALLQHEAEDWIAACEPPFWGRGSTLKRPAGELARGFRRTEIAVRRATGAQPKSVFQLNGAGVVGPGSLRGMPVLHRLREAGFAIWPFDDRMAGRLLVVEIYPRLLTDQIERVITSDPAARAAHLERRGTGLSSADRRRAEASPNAFDAALSALAMARQLPELASLPRVADPVLGREGIIWWPDWQAWHSVNGSAGVGGGMHGRRAPVGDDAGDGGSLQRAVQPARRRGRDGLDDRGLRVREHLAKPGRGALRGAGGGAGLLGAVLRLLASGGLRCRGPVRRRRSLPGALALPVGG